MKIVMLAIGPRLDRVPQVPYASLELYIGSPHT